MQLTLKAITALFLIYLSLLLTSTHVHGKQTENAFIIFGPATTNEFIGSENHNVVPMFISQFKLFNKDIEIEGLTARISLLNHDEWQIGLSSHLDFGRDEDVSDAVIASMKPIDSNLNIGSYFSYSLTDAFLKEDNLSFRTDISYDISDVHHGLLTTFTSTYTLPLYIPWRFEFELETTNANEDYMQTYFGVNTLDALKSGLPSYHANSGFRDITFNANIGLFFNPTWGVFTRISYSKLLNSAAKSPIVKQHGSNNQTFAGIGIFYHL